MRRFIGPDALRGMACTGVVLHHMAYFTPDAMGIPYSIARMLLGLGVPLFFMISAFAMSAAYENQISTAKQIKVYFVRRLMRIFPLYLFMLVIFMLTYSTFQHDWSTSKTIGVALLYFTLTFAVVPSLAHGIVWASWSISVELLFYLIFPIIAKRPFKLAIAICIVLLGHVISYILAKRITPTAIGAPWFWAVAWYQYIPFFALGVAAYHIQKRYALTWIRSLPGMLGILLTSAALTILILLLLGWPFDASNKIIISKYVNFLIASTPFLFAVFLVATISLPRLIVNKFTTFFGKLSYSIYLTHPLLVFSLIPVYKWIQFEFGQSFLSFFISAIVTFFLLLPIAYFSYNLLEKPFIRYGKRLTSKSDTR
jgi:peptidoglycan/LPS O-acetylase OafA/YrhL